MDEQKTLSSTEKLRQHFASRVLNQARQLIDILQLTQHDDWSDDTLTNLTEHAERLLASAKRFEANNHITLVNQLLTCFTQIRPNEPLQPALKEQINALVLQLSRASLRRSDDQIEQLPSISQKPVYVAIANNQSTGLIAKQMQSFRLYPKLIQTEQQLLSKIEQRQPAALVLDLDFPQKGAGLPIAQQQTGIPIIFTYEHEKPSLEQQLQILRANSIGLFQQTDVHAIINCLEKELDIHPEPAFKVLVVDDSRAQSLHTANTLKKNGIECQTVNDPMLVFDVLEAYAPDLVLMDMYMPGCTGVELARVIRQQREYINLPIIYLSGEEDKERQLAAMSEAGDDFLTKPVESNHLLITISNRIARARQLQNLIARDSLTGLLNHTHTLAELQKAINHHADQNSPVTFVMLDIDHFKQVNDVHGHPVGDDVIRNLALFLKQHLRSTDPIGRYGGEEFAIVLTDANEEQAIGIMDSIRTGFAELIHDNKDLSVTFSCGVAQWQGESLSELVTLADQALYASKNAGRNRVTGASTITS